MTYVLELLKRLNSVSVSHVHQDLLHASDLDEVIELFINKCERRIKPFGKQSEHFIRLRLINSNTIAANRSHVLQNNLN